MLNKYPQKKAAKNINKIEGFFYLTERIILAPFPTEDIKEPVSDYLNENHLNHYLVYNLAEHKYDNSFFNNAVRQSLLKPSAYIGYGVFISRIAQSPT